MNIVRGVLLVLAAGNVAHAVDPSACQRVIKFMLIDACGLTTKREFQHLPLYNVMTNDEIDKRYYDMLKANMIKGVEFNSIDEHNNNYNTYGLDYPDISHNGMNQLYYPRFKRSFIGVNMKNYAEPTTHEMRGSFQFMGRIPVEDFKSAPAPGELKRKCCGARFLCTAEDFKGFCG